MQVWGKLLKNNQTQSNDWDVKPDGASAWVSGTDCGSVNVYCFIFEPYKGTGGLSHQITISRKFGLKFQHY